MNRKSDVLVLVRAPVGGVLGLFTEWHYAAFVADGSLGYFLSHVRQPRLLTLVLIGAGVLIGFWAPFRRGEGAMNVQYCDRIRKAETTER